MSWRVKPDAVLLMRNLIMKNDGLRRWARWALDISGRQASISSKPGVQDTCRYIALSPYHGYWLSAYQLRNNWPWPAFPLQAFQRPGSLSVCIPCCFQKQSQQGEENEHHKMHELDHDLKKSTSPPQTGYCQAAPLLSWQFLSPSWEHCRAYLWL